MENITIEIIKEVVKETMMETAMEITKETAHKTAIVTGASSGIGYAISKKLSALGYEVFGIGRNFEKAEWTAADSIHPIVCDILDTDKLCACVRQITAKHQVHILVNNAGIGYYGLHEELSPDKIKKLVRTNLEAPMILTQQLLRHLKKNAGYIINISSVTAAQSNPHGCAYGATKAGLSSFSRSLFDEARKYGVKVITISPDMTQTNLYRNADFREGDEAASYLLPEDIAGAVEWSLTQRDSVLITDITLKPQLHRIRKKERTVEKNH